MNRLHDANGDKGRNASVNAKFAMMAVGIIAVIMVTVYFIGAQFRVESLDDGVIETGRKTDTYDSQSDSVQNSGEETLMQNDAPESSGNVNFYIPIVMQEGSGADEEEKADSTDDDPFELVPETHLHVFIGPGCNTPEFCKICGCRGEDAHGHDWSEATCTAPSVCKRCGEESGEPLGHKWKAATCTKSKRCSICGETKGEPLGHDWSASTCTEPKICRVCGVESGKAPGHKWAKATTKSPKTCTVCGRTSGDRLPNPIKVDAIDYTEEELELLAKLIYLEAGGSDYDGMLAVATVVINRVRSSKFANTLTGVIYAPGQFANANLNKDFDPPQKCYKAAKECLSGNLYDRSILYFKAARGSKSWSSRKYQFTAGDNYFYT